MGAEKANKQNIGRGENNFTPTRIKETENNKSCGRVKKLETPNAANGNVKGSAALEQAGSSSDH